MNQIALPSVSLIVPTYQEAENLPFLLDLLDKVRRESRLDIEVLIVDDNSRDGTEELFAARAHDWAKLIVRTADPGLSQAVCEGLKQAKNDVLVVMDGDLSHPPEAVPALVGAVADGFDFALGSRYVEGGSTSDWGLFRWLNSRVATLLAQPFSSVKDPMSGFFALRRDDYQKVAHILNPIGYKIGLELLVKCGCHRVKEVPIHFANRRYGKSKLTLKEQLRYIKHLRRLYTYKYGTWSHPAAFLVVGGLGTIVKLAVLTALRWFGVAVKAARSRTLDRFDVGRMVAAYRELYVSLARRKRLF